MQTERKLTLEIVFFFELGPINLKWGKVFRNGPSEIFEKLSSTNFTWSILEYFVPNILDKDLFFNKAVGWRFATQLYYKLNNFTGIFHSFEAEVQNKHFVKQRVKPPVH